MSDEQIIIEVQDRIDPSIAIKLAKIEALSIKGAIAVEKLFQAEARSTIELERLRTASVNLQISQERLNAAKTQGAIASEKLFQTEGKSTIVLENLRTASTNLETSQQKLSNAKIAGASASEKLFQAEARSTIELEKLRAASNGVLSSEERLKQEQTKTKISTEALTIAQTKLTTEQKKTSLATEKLSTQEQKTAKESKNLEKATEQASLAHLRLENAQKKALTSNNKTEQSHKSVGNSFASMARSLAAYAAAYVGVREVLQLVNAYVDLENKLRVVTNSQEQLAQVSAQVFDIANRTRTPVEETAKAFSRFDLALIQLGKSQQESLNLTETVNKAMIVSGANAGEQAAGLLQLSQAFNKGKLDGDEFRSVMELMPPVADAIAKQMGVTRGELLKLAPQGKITAEILAKSLEDAAIRIDATFAKTVPTLNQSMSVLKNKFTESLGEIEKTTGALTELSGKIESFGNNIPYLTGGVGALISTFMDLDAELSISSASGSLSMSIIQYSISAASYVLAGWVDLARAAKIAWYDFRIGLKEDLVETLKKNRASEETIKLKKLEIEQDKNSLAVIELKGSETAALDARLTKAGEAGDKLRKKQEALVPLTQKINDLSIKYTDLEDSITAAAKAGKAFSKPELAAKNAELEKYRKEIEKTKLQRDNLLGVSSLRGPSKPKKAATEESEKDRKSKLDFEAGVKVKHLPSYKDNFSVQPLGENARSVALGKVNDELDQEWLNLQRVGSEQESYNRLQQIMNDLTKAHVYLSDEEVAAYKAKTDALVFQNKVSQESNTIAQATIGQQEQLRAKLQALMVSKLQGADKSKGVVSLFGDMFDFDRTQEGFDIQLSQWERYFETLKDLRERNLISSKTYDLLETRGKTKIWETRLNQASSFFGEISKLQSSSSREAFEIGKAAAIAQATIDGIAAIQKAWAQGGIYGAAMAIAVGAVTGANIAQIASTEYSGYATGGEIIGGQQLIRVNEQGTETVMNAGATARNRPILAAMNAGATVGTGTTLSVKIENYGTSKQFEVQKDDDNNIRIIARDEAKAAIRSEVPKLVSSEIANPNSSTSKSLAQNTNTVRRR